MLVTGFARVLDHIGTKDFMYSEFDRCATPLVLASYAHNVLTIRKTTHTHTHTKPPFPGPVDEVKPAPAAS